MFNLAMYDCFLAVIFFFLINWFGKHLSSSGYMSLSVFYKADEAPIFNNAFRILSPLVLLLLTGKAHDYFELDHLNEKLWTVVPLIFLLRTIYNLIFVRSRLLNWKNYIFQAVCSSLLSYWIYNGIIAKGDYSFPDLQTFSNEFWLLIILFVYQTFNSVTFDSSKSIERKDNYIEHKYKSLKKEFGDLISSKSHNNDIEILTYSIIVFEMFNRPFLVRVVENFLASIFKAELTTGLMQVKHARPLSDSESIEKGIEILNENFKKVEAATAGKVPANLVEYYPVESQDYRQRILRRAAWFYS